VVKQLVLKKFDNKRERSLETSSFFQLLLLVGGKEMSQQKKKNELWEWMKALVIALLLAFVFRYFLFAPIVVDGRSMDPTLHNQNRMIVNKFIYKISDIDRFDIIVFAATEEKDYIKRVIGLPGETISYVNDKLYVNGKHILEPYLEEHRKQDPHRFMTNFSEITVPEGHVFVLGDNRQHSKDSRHLGPISMDKIIGEANIVFWPISEFRFEK
jgi:signal peptidase I